MERAPAPLAQPPAPQSRRTTPQRGRPKPTELRRSHRPPPFPTKTSTCPRLCASARPPTLAETGNKPRNSSSPQNNGARRCLDH
eukprot:scaffold206333_cov30-Tisochrysis_lutea.AAC.2